MKSAYLLPALPAAAAVAGLFFLAALRFGRLRWLALAAYTVSVPTLAILAYRAWDHYVGPDAFCFWQFKLSPAGISFLLPLAVASPPLLWAAGAKAQRESEYAASALACFALAGVLAAVMSDHLFLLAGACALGTWCAAGTAVLRVSKAGRLLPYLFPLALADLCLALGLLFYYAADPTRGLFYPAAPLAPGGELAVSCSLVLASALLRLGCFPFQRWISGASRGARELRLVHLLAVNLTLGTFLVFAVSRLLFAWGPPWTWICLGAAAAAMVELVRELLHASGRDEIWGLLCAACGAGIALAASPGGQAAATAARIGLWAGLPSLALVELAGGRGSGMEWAGVAGGASLLGLPPLAGFPWLWMAFAALGSEFWGGASSLFLAAVPVLFAGALASGVTALLAAAQGEGRRARAPAPEAAAALALAGFCVAVGLYPGGMADLIMREYGLPLAVPFAGWTSLGWAVLLCAVLAVVVAYAWNRRAAEERREGQPPAHALPLLQRRVFFPFSLRGKRRLPAAVLLSEVLLYAGWIAVMVYLGLK